MPGTFSEEKVPGTFIAYLQSGPSQRTWSLPSKGAPFTVAPSILNRSEVVRAMEREYPPLLRDAGIGGRAVVFFFIDEEGAVQDFRISELFVLLFVAFSVHTKSDVAYHMHDEDGLVPPGQLLSVRMSPLSSVAHDGASSSRSAGVRHG